MFRHAASRVFTPSVTKTNLVLPTALSTAPARYFSPSATARAPVATATMSLVSDVIKHDHRELEEYYDRIVNSTDHDEQTRYQNLFTWELARHSIGEELVVYPALEKLPGGKALADKDRYEHQKVKELLYQFQKLSPSDSEFLNTIKTLFADLKEHIAEEEQLDLPKLEESLGRDESADLAKSFQRTKKFVPTRSHPSTPDKPPFETVVGLMTAPMDKLADVFRKFPRDA